MIAGLLGKKLGMTQVYAEDGTLVPVTVIQAGPCQVIQIKTEDRDGYSAVQLGFEDRKRKGATKAESGHARVAKAEPKRFLRELPLAVGEKLELGQNITVDVFKEVKSVDVIGTSKGKGFQGGMKRHGFGGHPASHGASKDHRAPGSIGSNTDPGHVWRGTRMAGHMGNARCTTQNLKVVSMDIEKNLLLVRGAIPGPTGRYVIVFSRPQKKAKQ
jgi:large subunit ribosomal protein L3